MSRTVKPRNDAGGMTVRTKDAAGSPAPKPLAVRDPLPWAIVLAPHAAAIAAISISAHWAAASGANAYLAYGFAVTSLVAYVRLAATKHY